MKRTSSLALALVLLATAFNPATFRAQGKRDEAAFRQLVERLFEAYRKEDLNGVMSCWSARSPMFAHFKQSVQAAFDAIEETRFENVTLTRWKIGASQASVRLQFDQMWRNSSSKEPGRQNLNMDVQFVKEGGDWKFWQQIDAPSHLAERLDAAKTKEERAALLRDERELVTADLLSTIVDVGTRRTIEKKIDDARRLNDIAAEVADALGGVGVNVDFYWLRATIFNIQGRYREALEDYQRALRLLREAGARGQEAITVQEAITLKAIGEVYDRTGQRAEALSHLEAALKLLREVGVREQEARVLRSLGIIYGSSGQKAQALSRFEESIKKAREIGDKAGEGETLGNIGIVYESTGRYAEAMARYEEGLRLMREAGSREGEAQILNRIGIAYMLTGRYGEALGRFEESLKIARELKSKDAEASALNNMGNVYRRTGRYAEALSRHEASLELARESGDREEEAAALNNIGNDYQSTGRYAEALSRYEASLRVKRDLGDRAGEGETRTNIGIVYTLTGRFAEALSQHEENLKIQREVGDKESEARALGEIGTVYMATGRYADALGMLEVSLKIAREFGYRAVEVTALGNFGNVYRGMGKYAEALRRYEAVLAITREMGDRADEALTLLNIGTIHALTGKPAEAQAQYEAGLKIAREIGDREGESTALGNIGITHRMSGRYAEALGKYEESLKLKLAIGDKEGEATARNNIGHLNLLTDKYPEALAQHQASLLIAREIGDTLGEAVYLSSIATVYRAQKRWQQAADTYRQAIPLIELVRTQVREPSLQTGFFAQYTSPYYGLVESLLELGAGRDEIFSAGERAKARSLVELMTGGKVNVLKSMTDGERQREQELRANFTAASAQLSSAYSGPPPERRRIDELKRQVHKARDEYDEFRVKLFLAHPELQLQRASYDPLALARLSELLFAKDRDLCLLSYLVGDGKTFLFVITSGAGGDAPVNLKAYTLKDEEGRELTDDALRERVAAFRLRYTNESGPYKQLARGLYDILLAPARAELKGRSHVVVIPDGMLYALPFQALLDERGKHFIESHSVSYAPSVTALTRMMQLADKRKGDAATRPLFAMGRRAFPDQAQYRDSDLPRAEEQVKSIARLFDVNPWTGEDATKARAVLEMGAARFVHFATHGELNEVAPMESAIVLGKGAGDDGMLYARELVDMDLQAELVVLSACDTGLGQQVNGEGILGLTWALFVAGTPTSILTQWKVRDDSMNRLMLEFYREVRQSGTNGQPLTSKAEALRRAQLNLMRDENYKHPYHWAPTTLVGAWQ